MSKLPKNPSPTASTPQTSPKRSSGAAKCFASVGLFLLTLIFCIVLFCVESFSFFAPAFLAARIVNSTLLTLIVILVVDLLMEKK